RAEKVEAKDDDLEKAEARLAVIRAEQALRQAKGELHLLRVYTKAKEIHRFENQVVKAQKQFLAREAAFELEKSREAKLQEQVEKCKLYAPADGLIVYGSPPVRAGQPMIEEGAAVRERQKIFSLFDPTGPMRGNTKVHEAWVDRLSPGQRARIKVDAFPDQVISGEVKAVAPLPDISRFSTSDVKVYTTLVALDKELASLRPGMTAEVEILVTELDNVLSVP